MTRFRRPPLLDAVLACGLAVLGVAQLWYEAAGLASVVLMIGITLPVALRRIVPLAAVVVSWTVILLEGGLGADVTSQGHAAILALWITVYSVARYGPGAHPRAGLVWAMACVLGSVITTTGFDVPSMLLTTVITVGPWLAGYAVRRSESGRARAEDDAELARAEKERHARDAVDDERTRIAREVHDVLGHTLGLMVLQLGAAEQNLDTDPVRARAAVRSARQSGKAALAEVRYLIGLDGDVIAASAPPTSGLLDIPDLVEQNRRAGVDVTLELDLGATAAGGEPRDSTPSATDLAAYRIVQESLTNALRHGCGPVRVDLRRTPTEVTVAVHSAMQEPAGVGDRAAADVGGAGRRDAAHTGRGIIGMTERARSCGGTLTAGPVSNGFLVEARLPTWTTDER
ncbi:histidine kinase [Intrasporangium sp.]|uniref:sensor histidine kinase n=1 Tax=Intrasporangium sp. TaxID=1925024 RepID=UPI003365561E